MPSFLPHFPYSLIHSTNMIGAPIMSNTERGHECCIDSTLEKAGHYMEI